MGRLAWFAPTVVLAISACQPADAPATAPRTTAPRTTAPPAAASSAEPERAVSKAEAQQWLERYFAGEEEMTTDDPTVVFIAGDPDGSCKALPPVRPQGFEVTYWHRGGEPRPDAPQYGVSAEVCHFEWRLLHLDSPPSFCAPLGAAALDALYAELRAFGVSSIRVRKNDNPSPHRGGYGLSVRWPGARCEILDMVHWEVEEESVAAFTGALAAFREAYNAGRRAARAAPLRSR